ncbi:MAG TPA: hypothetical protein VGP93_04320, partial [Polyangiaceae bacterium]|nr:hypothetical protein [Polyangiaceae bacterium]
MTKIRFGTLLAVGTWLLAPTSFADVGAEVSAEGDNDDVGAQMSGEEKGEGEAKAGGGTAAAVAVSTSAEEKFASVNGPTGAGIALTPEPKGRFWGELGLHTQSRVTIFSPLLGGGYKVMDQLELEAVLPFSYGSVDLGIASDSKFAIGDPYIGVNYLSAPDKFRYKVGGGLTLPIAKADDFGGFYALFGAGAIRGLQEYHYWMPETMTIYVPARLEYGDKVVFAGDMSLGFHIPTDGGGRDAEVSTTIAPGVGAYLGDEGRALVGGRLPIWWLITQGGDNVQIALEPYFRYDFAKAFVNARMTLNLDHPLGFAFDTGGYWGLH